MVRVAPLTPLKPERVVINLADPFTMEASTGFKCMSGGGSEWSEIKVMEREV